MSETTDSAPWVVGITGATGFVGKHLVARLSNQPGIEVRPISRGDFALPKKLAREVGSCNVVVHLAAMNRGNDDEIYDTNVSLVRQLGEAAAAAQKPVHIVMASSTQREADSKYGRSKRDGETVLTEYAHRFAFPTTICVIPNVFGPGCRPFYNSVVATFCHQLANGEQPRILEDRTLELIFVGDLAAKLAQIASQGASHIVTLHGEETMRVSELLARLAHWRDRYFGDGVVPAFPAEFDRKLYATFLSHIPPAEHRHVPKVHEDDRGTLFEVIRTMGGGQVFFSTTRPGVIRGNHFHTRKIEWFCVVQGEATIRLRRIGTNEIHEFRVSGRQPQFISIPAFHTHHIENSGSEELLTMFWCSELFEQSDPDTYFEKVA